MYDTIKLSNRSYARCIALCDCALNLLDINKDDVLWFATDRATTLEEIITCFNEIFKYHKDVNFFSEQGLTYIFTDKMDNEIIKSLIDKVGFETILSVFNDDYFNCEILEIDYRDEEYKLNFYEYTRPAIENIKESFKYLNYDSFFTDNNDAINEIIDKYWMNTIEFDYDEWRKSNAM